MSLLAKVGSFSTGTGTGTIAITGVGFTPKAVLFWWSGRTETTDAAGSMTHNRGFGWLTGSSSRACVSSRALDAAATSDVDSAHRSDCCVISQSATGAVDGRLDFSAFGADGFSLNIDDSFPASYRIHYLALGGDDLTNVATGTAQLNTVTGAQAVTGVGFQPDCVLLLSICNATAPPVTQSVLLTSFGIATANGGRFILLNQASGSQPAALAHSYCGDFGEVFARCVANVLDRASLTSLDADGFTLNVLETQGTIASRISYLALKGGRFALTNLLTRTDANPIQVAGLGIGAPVAALFMSHAQVESTQDTSQEDDIWSIGAASGAGDQRAAATRDENASDPTQVSAAVEHDAVYINLAANGAVDGVMQLSSFDTDGFTCAMSNADPAQKFVGALVFGSNPAQVPIIAGSRQNTLLRM